MATLENCKSKLTEALKDQITDKDAKALFDFLLRKVANRMKRTKESEAEAFDKASKEFTEDLDRFLKMKQRAVALDAIARANFKKFQEPFKRKGLAALAYNGGIESNVEGSRDSMDLDAQQTEADLLADMNFKMQKEDVLTLFNSKSRELEYTREMAREGTSKDPEIRKLGTIIRDTQDKARKLANKYGANISTIMDWIVGQTHDTQKMLRPTNSFRSAFKLRIDLFKQFKGDFARIGKEITEMGFQKWKNFTLPLVDERSFGVQDPDTWMRAFFDNKTSDRHPQVIKGDTDLFAFSKRTVGQLAARLSRERKMILKDADGFYKYNQEYGQGTIHDNITDGLRKGAKNIAILKRWGPSGRDNFDDEMNKLLDQNKRDKKIKKQVRMAGYVFDEMENKTKLRPGAAGNIIKATQAFIYLTRTGSLTEQALPDIALAGAVMREHGAGPFNAAADVLSGFFTNFSKSEREEIGEELGVLTNHIIGDSFNRFGSVDMKPGLASKTLQLQMKYNGIQKWDLSLRTGVGSFIARKLAKSKDLEFNNLPANINKLLPLYGIKKPEWDIIRRFPLKLIGNKEFITPESVDEITKKEARILLGKKRISDQDLIDAKADLKGRLKKYFIDQTNRAQPISDARTKALFNRGTQSDTAYGMMARIFSIFKSFSAQSTRRTYGRFIFGSGADNLYQAFIQGKADIHGLIAYSLDSMFWGFMSNAVRALTLGLTIPSLNHKETWLDAALTGGALTMYGDYMTGQYNNYGHTLLSAAAGPGGQLVNQLATTMSTLAHLKNPVNALQTFLRSPPILNLPYVQTAYNHLFYYHLMERLHPGYLERMQNRVETQTGQTFWFPPGG